MSDELKPCPFCGAAVELHELAGFYHVRCSRLDCQGSGDWSDSNPQNVTAAWNTRPVEDALRAQWAAIPWASLQAEYGVNGMTTPQQLTMAAATVRTWLKHNAPKPEAAE